MKRILAALVFALMISAPATADTISVDEVEYTGNVDGFQGEVFSIFFADDASTEDIQAFVSPQTLSEEAGEGNQVTQSIEISAEETLFEARYNVRDTERMPVYPLERVQETFDSKSGAEDFVQNRCLDVDGSGNPENDALITTIYSLSDPLYDYTVFCVGQERGEGQWEVFDLEDNADTNFETEWTVQADGEDAESATLSNNEIGQGTTARIGENTQIEWQGNLDTGENPPGTSDYLVLKNRRASGEFKLVSESSYENYRNYLSNLQDKLKKNANYNDDLVTKTFFGGTQLADGEFQSAMDGIVNEATDPVTGVPLTSNADFENGLFVKELDYSPSYPSFLVYIDGVDYVKVEKNAGEPEIQDSQIEAPNRANPFEEGQGSDQGIVTIPVRNVGEAPGEFESRVNSCGGNFRATGDLQKSSVQPGGIVEFQHEISFTSPGDFDSSRIIENCDYQVTDTSSGTTDSANFEVVGDPAETCDAGGQFPSTRNGSKVILENGPNCDVVNEVEVCEENEFVGTDPDGSLSCEEGSQPPTTGECTQDVFGTGLVTYQDPVCDNLTGGFAGVTTGNVFKGLVLVLGVIYGFGFGHSNLSRFAEIENERTRVVIGMVIAGLLGALVFGIYDLIVGFISNPIGLVVFLAAVVALFFVAGPVSALRSGLSLLRRGSGAPR